MKKLILQLLFIMMLSPGMAQIAVFVTGTLTDQQTGNPIPNYPVTILSDSTQGWFYFNTVYTDAAGYYSDSLWSTQSSGLLYIHVWDCNQVLHQDTCNYAQGNTFFSKNFTICSSAPPCDADFSYYNYSTLTLSFTDQSTGSPVSWNWSFGDGNSSTSQNPIHSFLTPGYYTVVLAISNPGTSCYDSVFKTVLVGDSISNCHSQFMTIQDSLDNLKFHFFDQSTGNITSWFWHFGDGVYSQDQNPTHIYAQPGVYVACLTVQGMDSLCYDVSCDTIFAGVNTGCQAYYVSIPDSLDAQLVRFFDNSTGNIISWAWDFGDPASGSSNYSNQQDAIHLFSAPGAYTVCLTIQGADSSCYDTYCSTIIVGNNAGCQAQFTYYTDSIQGAGSLVHFIDLSYGTPTSWLWDFGDGSPASTLQNPDHIYVGANLAYYVCLTIQCQGVTSTWCAYVTVGGNTRCTSYFTYSRVGLTVAYQGQMVNGLPATYDWGFGDGDTGTGQNQTHTYTVPGIYYVTLTTTDTSGCVYSTAQSVMVGDSLNFNQIYGQVYAGNFPSGPGSAMIFSLDTNINYNPFMAQSSLDSNGVYYFTMVPSGNYVVYATPFDSVGYLPTYYGDVLTWQEATVISLGQANNPYDISLIPAGELIPGIGTITGMINTGDVPTTMVDKIKMILMDENLNPIAFENVNSSGGFYFPSMDLGTYYLHPELAGCTSDRVKVFISPVYPHTTVNMTFTGSKILGVETHHTELEAGVVYPNPVNDAAYVSVTLKTSSRVNIEVFNLMGQRVYQSSLNLSQGVTRIQVPMAGLNSGLYSLRVTTEQGETMSRKLLKSN